MKCPNCNANLTCTCKKRTASDGAIVCTKCKQNYEALLKQKK